MLNADFNSSNAGTIESQAATSAVQVQTWDAEPESNGVPLSHYLWVLKRHRWSILTAILATVIATAIISLRLTPIYESTATVDIDRRIPTAILGQDAIQSAINDADQFITTQIRLIQSDSVLRPIARKYRLQELEKGKSESNPIRKAQSESAPVVLRNLSVSRPPNTYLLLISYSSPDRDLAANVANGLAQSYIEHTYFIRYKAAAGLSQFMEKQLEELKAKMERSSAALAQFERELNVINPEEKTNILSARLLQLNTEYTNSQADRVKKEATYISVKGGSLEAAEVSTQGEALKKLLETLNAAEHKLAETKTVYGANHPEYRTALASVVEARRQIDEATASIGKRVSIEYTDAVKREQMLQRAVAETKADFDRLNARSFDYQTLKREADSDKKLYEELVRKIKEATINASFQNSSIRIADPALPAFRPEFPNIPLNLVLAFALSSIVSIGAAIAIDTLDNTVRDPEQISRTLKVEVVGSLPIIRSWRRQSALIPPRAVARAESANDESSDRSLSNFDEAIRTVRNSILLTDFDRRLGSVLMTSAAPSEGKSTVAVHLAIAHADQGHKTLLIDADMRRPSVHKFFQMPNTQGLSGVLSGSQRWRDVLLQPREGVDLHVLPAGPTTRRGADLVGKHLPVLLDEASAEFDLIIVDAPPLLGFPEPLQLAAAVDGVVVVTRAGQTSWAAVASVVKTLNRLRARTLGVILNEVHRELSSTYYYYGYYYKYYGRHRDDA